MSYVEGRAVFSRELKRRILEEEPVCGICRLRPSVEADHIIPVAFGGSNSRANGQGVCGPCHDRKTRSEILEGSRRRAERGRFPRERHPGEIP